ncbi:DUF1573 domain-containing protein [Pelobacter seleniigenes]|uniref:DUF1573 domain-containing protein n=1 Tax=Pelobacter seleniigenes TaxID=407188 RepID=UPI0006900893|nr:DUF1573 domain-containing protein [Pelobacter seleniigenes]
MRCALLSVLLLLFPAFCFAAPKLTPETLNYDFGAIVQGETVEYSFRFQNSGDQVLEIGQVRTSCGCTAALLSARRLAPGEIGELKVRFNSQGFRGKIHKTITVDTNDPEQSSVIFNLHGMITLELYATLERVNWGRVKEPVPLQDQFDIVNDSKHVVTLTGPQIAGAGIAANISRLRLEPGQKATVNVTGEFLEGNNRIAGYVIISTDFSAVPQIRVPVSARLSTK